MKWINIKEKSPEIEERVLVYDIDNVYMGKDSIKIGFISDWNEWVCLEYMNLHLTHWMPLPEPPKDKE